MSQDALVYVEDVNARMDAGFTTIRLYSATSPGGSFSSTGDTAGLVEDQEHYTITDGDATAQTWWRYDLFDSVATATALSPPFPAQGTRLRDIRIEAAIAAQNGSFKASATANGTTTTLVDAGLGDQGQGAHFLEGAWIYRPSAAAAGDLVRRVQASGFTPATGTLTIDRAWTNAPADEEEYHIFNWFPPIDQPGIEWSWDRCVREALTALRFRGELVIGEGTADGDSYFPINAFANLIREEDIRWVYLRTYQDDGDVDSEVNMARNGNWWDAREQHTEDADFVLQLGLAPSTNESIILDCVLSYDEIYDDDDLTVAPPDLIAATAAFFAADRQNIGQSGRYQGDLALLARRAQRVAKRTKPRHFLTGIRA